MKNSVEGVYKEGRVVLNEQVPFGDNTKVLVVFLEENQDKNRKKEEFLKTCGSWIEEKDADTIISEIYGARKSREEDISL